MGQSLAELGEISKGIKVRVPRMGAQARTARQRAAAEERWAQQKAAQDAQGPMMGQPAPMPRDPEPPYVGPVPSNAPVRSGMSAGRKALLAGGGLTVAGGGAFGTAEALRRRRVAQAQRERWR